MGTPSTTQNVSLAGAASVKGMAGGLPFIRGTWFFVDPTSGSSSNDGLTPYTAFASIATAYTACTSGAGDGIALLSPGTTTAGYTSYLTAAITWSKWNITVVGVCAPTRFAQRARISTAAANLATLLTITGSNNSFYNISLYNGGTTGAGCVTISSGHRNYFENVHFMGGMGMTTPTIADTDLTLNNASENTFVKCVFGSDTFDKSDIAGTEILISGDAVTGGCMRNRFYDCEFISYRTAGTTAGMVKISAVDVLNRTLLFDNCFFHMYRDGDVTAEATVVIGSVPNNGFIIFKNCLRHGFTDWGAVAATARIYSGSATQAEAGGITVAANGS